MSSMRLGVLLPALLARAKTLVKGPKGTPVLRIMQPSNLPQKC